MRAAFLLAGMVCAAQLALAQGLFSVHSPNGSDVWAVGKQGTVFRSYDGGTTWSSFQQGTQSFRSVATRGSMVWVVGEEGTAFRSTNAGDAWTSMIVGGVQTLRAVEFPTLTTGWIAGDGGSMWKTTDGGLSWIAQSSGTVEQINALAFIDSLTGYAVDTKGVVLKTTNGGASWVTIGVPDWRTELTAVAARSQTVYVTGLDAFCAKSENGGASWTLLDFKTVAQSDVNGVYVTNDFRAFFIGGGGYIRRTSNTEALFAWAQHPLHATLSDVFFSDNVRGWVCSDKFNVVMRTTDGGGTWLLPQGTSVNMAWQQTLNASGAIGMGMMINPWNKNRISVALGKMIYMSNDRGSTWVPTSSVAPTSGSTHSFYISPKDTNLFVAAFTGGGDHIRRSTNRG